MKTIITSIAFLGASLLSLQSVEAKAYGRAGCGLGSLVMGKNSQVLAATTNGTSGSQTFGISSGTSNCEDGPGSAHNFIENNKLALSNDIARGQGETINGLARAYGCENVSSLGSTLQSSYQNIFSTEGTSAFQIEESIKNAIRSEPAMSCSHLS